MLCIGSLMETIMDVAKAFYIKTLYLMEAVFVVPKGLILML